MQTSTEAAVFAGENVRVDFATAELIERGVEFHATLGKTVATAYFKKNLVPEAIIHRILGSSPSRRPSRPVPAPRYY